MTLQYLSRASLALCLLVLTACASTPEPAPVEAKPPVKVVKKAPVVTSTVVSSNPLPKRARLKKLKRKAGVSAKQTKQVFTGVESRKVVRPTEGVANDQELSPQANASNLKNRGQRRVQSPILRKMLRQADEAALKQQWSQSESYLERALRVDSRNAAVWQRLAEVKLAQDRPLKAIQFARKSISLSTGNVAIAERGWMVVEESNIRLNKPERAAMARKKRVLLRN